MPLDPAALVVAAMQRSGAADLATEAVSEPLEVLVRSLEEEARLTTAGRREARRWLQAALVERGRRLRATVPSGAAAPRVVVVLGLPGTTGTAAGELVGSGAAARPHPDGDGALLRAALVSLEPERRWHVPAYAEWLDGADLRATYRWLAWCLAASPAAREPLVLEDPLHGSHLASLCAALDVVDVVAVEADVHEAAGRWADASIDERRRWSRAVDDDVVRRYWRWRFEVLEDRLREGLSRNAPPPGPAGPPAC